jgi:uncharacterized membrane protein YdjX (TVP38/TMEM64 family)
VLVAAIVAMKPAWLAALGQALSPESLAAAADTIRGFGALAPVVSVLLMIVQSVVAPLPGSLIAAANGIIFGVWRGSLISWVGGMAGAVATYLIGRVFGDRAAARWAASPQWRRLEQFGGRHGFWLVLMARITPILSLDFVGYLAGAARMPFRSYLLANLIGVAPGMVIYTVVGHDLVYARDASWRIGVAALLLIALLFVGRRFFARR